jgi:thymidylate kinase
MLTVCVSGIDGSGKTTQLTLLERYLRKVRGVKTYRLWLRWFSFTTYMLYLYARLARRTIIVQTRARPVHVHAFWIDRALRILYPRFLLLDLTTYFLVHKIFAKLARVNVVLLDRCFVDALVDLVWEVRDASFLRSVLARAALALTLPMKVMVLDVEPYVAAKRKRDIVSIKELAFKRKLFRVFAEYVNAPTIEAGKMITNTLRNIIRILGALVSGL